MSKIGTLLTGAVIGFVMASAMAASSISAANDTAARVAEQYRDCHMIGDYPTNADMLPESEAGHE